jgi:signal transduction histidine kinase
VGPSDRRDWRNVRGLAGASLAYRLVACVLIVAASTTLGVVLTIWFGSARIFLYFFPALFVCAWIAGRQGGLLCLGLSLLGILYLMPPMGFSLHHSAGEWLSLGVFVATGYLIVGTIARLQHANARLAEADRRKNEFLAVLGHELRNPLAAIRNAMYVLDRLSAEDQSTARFRAVVSRQSAHLARMVDDLLDVARIDRGHFELRAERIDARDVVQRAVEATQGLVKPHGHEVIVSLPDAPLLLWGDPARLEQVMSNLLSNAAKYTESGGRISVSAQRDGDQMILRVKDTGMGISSEMLPRIFDLFVRGAAGPARARGGLGIGLALVRDVVSMHCGTIDALSEGVGRGSEFVIRLPALAPDALPVAEANSATSATPVLPPAHCRSVLVVEDDEDVADMLCVAIRMWGYSVKVAHDGRAAITMSASEPPDVVLLDIGLPDLDGYEVARRLRAQLPAGHDARLVALTGFGQPEDRRRAEQAGFDVHLTKPTDMEELQRVLEA